MRQLKKKIYVFCLGEKHSTKECKKSRKYRIDGCDKTHNRLLHQKKKQQVSAEKPKGRANLTSDVESVLGLLQIAKVQSFGENGNFEDTLAPPVQHKHELTTKFLRN